MKLQLASNTFYGTVDRKSSATNRLRRAMKRIKLSRIPRLRDEDNGHQFLTTKFQCAVIELKRGESITRKHLRKLVAEAKKQGLSFADNKETAAFLDCFSLGTPKNLICGFNAKQEEVLHFARDKNGSQLDRILPESIKSDGEIHILLTQEDNEVFNAQREINMWPSTIITRPTYPWSRPRKSKTAT